MSEPIGGMVRGMEYGRNDPCPCGSGRKYKQCCLGAIELELAGKRREEHFFDRKYKLTEDLFRFLAGKLGRRQVEAQLAEAFPKLRGDGFGFGKVWLHFVHRYDNGFRGIEWLLSERGGRYAGEDRAMLERWRTMRLGLYQIVALLEKGYEVENALTGERLFMPFNEVTHGLQLWSVSLAFMEPFEDGCCIHGVSMWSGPETKRVLLDFIRERQEDELRMTGVRPEPTAMMERHYRELIGLQDECMKANRSKLPDYSRAEKRKLLNVSRTYECRDTEELAEMLLLDKERYELVDESEQSALIIRMKPDDEDLALIPAEVRRAYGLDNVRILLEFAEIRLEHEQVLVTGWESEELDEVFELLEGHAATKAGMKRIGEEEHPVDVPVGVFFKSHRIMTDLDVTATEINAFAQLPSGLSWIKLPYKEGKSPLQLAQEGRRDELEDIMREREYEQSLQVNGTDAASFEWTRFFVRSALGLPCLSPILPGEGAKEAAATGQASMQDGKSG